MGRPAQPLQTLTRARRALAGQDSRGRRVAPSMFDADVVSFAHGEGIRRPFPGAIAAAAAALSDAHRAPIENYMFLRRSDELEAQISREFQSLGVPDSWRRTDLAVYSAIYVSSAAGPRFLRRSQRKGALWRWAQ